MLFLSFPCAWGQAAPTSTTPELTRLCAEERWNEVVSAMPTVSQRSADLDLCYGLALAYLEKWNEADKILRNRERQDPRDKRFPLELAGVAFKQSHYKEATMWLHRGLRLDPHDAYANDFLGTVYFLQGNLEAALKYWNRVKKPEIVAVRSDPVPKLDPIILDRAFAFSPASTLQLQELLASEVRLRSLAIFPKRQFDLQPRADGKFDLIFRNREKRGIADNKWMALLMMLRGLPAQSIYPEVFNLRHEALNFTSFYRWDKEKRRVRADFSGPLRRNPAQHFHLGLDLRNENWDVRPSFTGIVPELGSLNLRREAAAADLTSLVGGRWQWSAGVEFSHRDFRNVILGPAVTSGLLAEGFQLKQTLQLNAHLWRYPERRMTLSGSVSSQAGHIWSQPGHTFEKLQTSLYWNWFPLPVGDDYEVQQRIWAGKTFGDAPFDELSVLGIGGDNDLWMRGHVSTRDGMKGSGPLGRGYFLSNWELDKNIHRFQLLTLKAGPFVDTGKITDSIPGLGSHKWLCDVGVEAKAGVLGFGVIVSYGKDLRSGNNALFVSFLR